jgi:heme/copper-type cytochrome/quinol oxidase subunit 2
MNLMNILFEPYILIILISIVITIIMYFIIQSDAKNKEKDKTLKNNNATILLYTFISSLIILVVGKFSINYIENNYSIQKGGGENTIDEDLQNITIVDDDIDVDIY